MARSGSSPETVPQTLPRSEEFSNSGFPTNESVLNLLEGFNNSSEGTPLPYARVHSRPDFVDTHDPALLAPVAAKGDIMQTTVEVKAPGVSVKVTVSPNFKPISSPRDEKDPPKLDLDPKDIRTFANVDLTDEHKDKIANQPFKNNLQKATENHENKENKPHFIYRLVYNATVQPGKYFKKFAKKHPYALTGALVTALFANGINAMMGPSGKQPDEIIHGWWGSMSFDEQLESLQCLIASLIVNGYINAPLLADLANTYHNFKQDRFKNITAFSITLFSLVASGAITYQAVVPWATVYGAPFLTIPSIISTFITRFLIGASIAADRIEGSFIRTPRSEQMELIEALKDLENPNFREHMQDYIKKFNELDEVTGIQNSHKLDDVTADIFEEIHNYVDRNSIVLNRSRQTTIINGLKSGLNICFALYMANAVLPVFTQKGFDGATILHITDKNTSTDAINIEGALIGFLPGLASAIFYYMTSSDTFSMLKNTLRFLLNSPDQLLYCALWIYINFKASSSMFNISQGVMDKSDGIFPFLRQSMPAILALLYGNFPVKNAIAGGCVNGTITLRGEFLNKGKDPDYKGFDSKSFDYDDFIRRCEGKVANVREVTPGISHISNTLDTLLPDRNKKKPWCAFWTTKRKSNNDSLTQSMLDSSSNEDPADSLTYDSTPQFDDIPDHPAFHAPTSARNV